MLTFVCSSLHRWASCLYDKTIQMILLPFAIIIVTIAIIEIRDMYKQTK